MKKTFKYFLTIFLPIFASAILLNGCKNEEVVQNDFLFQEYKNGEEIILHSVNGGEKTVLRKNGGFVVAGEEDKILMFDFFGTFCQPCREEALSLSRLWQNNAQKLILIGLDHFETVSDAAVKKFADDYGAYYFLSNDKENNRLIAQILKDIKYEEMEQLPFKVLIKNGEYQVLSDYWNNKPAGVKFYLGKIPSNIIQDDLNKIYATQK